MAQKFEVLIDGEINGPYLPIKLMEMARDGRLAPTDKVRREGGATWQAASDVQGLVFGTKAKRYQPSQNLILGIGFSLVGAAVLGIIIANRNRGEELKTASKPPAAQNAPRQPTKVSTAAPAPSPSPEATQKKKPRVVRVKRDALFRAMLLNGMELRLAPESVRPYYGVDGLDVSFSFSEEEGEITDAVLGFTAGQRDQKRAIAVCARLIAEITKSDISEATIQVSSIIQSIARNAKLPPGSPDFEPTNRTLNGWQIYCSTIGVVVAFGLQPIE